jgi:hypothetical protein
LFSRRVNLKNLIVVFPVIFPILFHISAFLKGYSFSCNLMKKEIPSCIVANRNQQG